jgi:hypothetical protein
MSYVTGLAMKGNKAERRDLGCVAKPVVKGDKAELQKLAGEIGSYEEQFRKTVVLALRYKLEIGRRLARAKSILPRGKVLTSAHHEFGWTPRHVQRDLTLAENASRVSCLPPG